MIDWWTDAHPRGRRRAGVFNAEVAKPYRDPVLAHGARTLALRQAGRRLEVAGLRIAYHQPAPKHRLRVSVPRCSRVATTSSSALLTHRPRLRRPATTGGDIHHSVMSTTPQEKSGPRCERTRVLPPESRHSPSVNVIRRHPSDLRPVNAAGNVACRRPARRGCPSSSAQPEQVELIVTLSKLRSVGVNLSVSFFSSDDRVTVPVGADPSTSTVPLAPRLRSRAAQPDRRHRTMYSRSRHGDQRHEPYPRYAHAHRPSEIAAQAHENAARVSTAIDFGSPGPHPSGRSD